MKPVYQLPKSTDCIRASLASILEIEMDEIPDCFHSAYLNAMDAFTNVNYGLRTFEVPKDIVVTDKSHYLALFSAIHHQQHHCVVALNNRIVHDPSRYFSINTSIKDYEFISQSYHIANFILLKLK